MESPFCINGIGIGNKTICGITVLSDRLTDALKLSKVIVIHTSLDVRTILATSMQDNVVGHVLPITGNCSHAAWAVEYYGKSGLATNNSIPAGIHAKLDPKSGQICEMKSAAVEVLDKIVAVQRIPELKRSSIIEVRTQLLTSYDLQIAQHKRACGIGEAKAELFSNLKNTTSQGVFDPVLIDVVEKSQWRDIPIRFFDNSIDKGACDRLAVGPLGMRGVRMLQTAPEMLDLYISLIPIELRSTCTCILPMVNSPSEVEQVRLAVNGRVKNVGALVETPNAVIEARQIADVSDMILVGPNDLAQFTFAWSRDYPYERMTSRKFDRTLFQQLNIVAKACNDTRTRWGLPIDWSPTPELTLQVIELNPTFIAVSPAYIEDWLNALS